MKHEITARVELTDEEKKWLDDLWSLDEAPESIKFNKNFMLHAVKKNGSCLEYTSEELKNDKEVVLEAVKESGRVLKYASENLRKDVSFALSVIKSANEKNKTDIFSYDLDNGDIEHFDASVFGNEELVNELVSVTLIPFLRSLANNYGMDNNVYNVIKIHKEKLEVAIKKDFELRLVKSKEIIKNNDNDFRKKLSLCFGNIFNNYYTNAVACFDTNYNLVENSNDQDWNMLLSQKLFEIVTEEVIEELENQASNFEDINDLIGYVSVEGYNICCDHGYDNPRTGGKAAELFNKLPNYASEEDVSTIIYCFRMTPDWDVSEDCTDAFESIIAIIEEKMSDKSVIEKLKVFDDVGHTQPFQYFSSDFKSTMLEEINEMDEAEKEDLYNLDEIVGCLEK